MPASIDDIDIRGLPALSLTSKDGARAVVSLFGAQVLSWKPARGFEQLYLSEKACLDGKTPIRGGIPVCFPQFADQGKLTKHGFVRQASWTVRERRTSDDFAMVTLGLTENEQTLAQWPSMFDAELTVAVSGERLDIELEIENTGHAPFGFTAALHTYLRVSEVENVRLEGLYGHEFRDKTDNDGVKRDTGDVLIVESETDRIYHDVDRPLLLRDGSRSLGIHSEGFPDIVIWNPWEARCSQLPDMPPLDFRHMLCVESAAARSKVQLDAGESWFGRQTLVTL